MVANIGGCPLGVCIINGEVVFFDLPYYICKVVTTSSEDSRRTPLAVDLAVCTCENGVSDPDDVSLCGICGKPRQATKA